MASVSSKCSTNRLGGKVVIITGGASGIGVTTAMLFHANGALVVVADIQDDLGRAVVAKLGGGVEYVRCDITDEGEVSNLMDASVAEHGKLDIMYNKAGIIDKIMSPIVDTTLSDMDRVIQVNLYGSFLGAKHAARVMMLQRKGFFLFTGSVCSVIHGITMHMYSTSKNGMLGLSRKLAAELGEFGMRDNSVAPSAVPGMGLLSHVIDPKDLDLRVINLKVPILTPEEVAHAVLYLACDEVGHANGVNLVLAGGVSLHLKRFEILKMARAYEVFVHCAYVCDGIMHVPVDTWILWAH